jgi:hypothetical protein
MAPISSVVLSLKGLFIEQKSGPSPHYLRRGHLYQNRHLPRQEAGRRAGRP